MNNLDKYPLVSVVIPVYNGSNYLREAIDSALAQTYWNIEIIVVNDGSNDGNKTRDMALAYGDKIRYYEKQNGGVASALNLGIREMRGLFFSWLSHDDIYFPDKIEKQFEYYLLLNNKNAIIFSDEDIIDENGNIIRKIKIGNVKQDELEFNLLLNNFIGGCSLLIPRSAFDGCGVFNENLKCTQDYEMWFRMIKAGYEFKYIPMTLGQYRVHPNRDSDRKRDILIGEKENISIWVLDNFTPEELWGKDKDNFRYYIKTAILFAHKGLMKPSNISMIKASAYKPGNFILFYYKTIIRLISKKSKLAREIRSIIRNFRNTVK